MIEAVVFDVGRVLFQWELRALFEKLIADPAELDFVLAEVITEQWHFEHDAGRPLAEMVPERKALFPAHAQLIEACAADRRLCDALQRDDPRPRTRQPRHR